MISSVLDAPAKISVDTCVMIIGVSLYNLSSPLPLNLGFPHHPHTNRTCGLHLQPGPDLQPGQTLHQEPRTSSGNGSSPSPAISITIPMEQRKSNSSSGPRNGHVDLTGKLLQFWVSESEMKTSEQNGSSNLMVWFFGSFDLYLQFTHRKCLLKKCLVLTFQAADFLTSQRWRELSGWSTAGVQGHWATVGGRLLSSLCGEVGGVLGFKWF